MSYITIRELCTDIANFFEATPIHIFTKSPLEPKLESHKKAAGKNVVLLVSNGVDDNAENKSKTLSEPANIRVLNKYSLVDSEVTKLGHDRSHLLYPDIVDFINKKENQELHHTIIDFKPREEQSKKAYSSMVVTDSGIFTLTSEEQFSNALLPINCKVFGRVSFFI